MAIQKLIFAYQRLAEETLKAEGFKGADGSDLALHMAMDKVAKRAYSESAQPLLQQMQQQLQPQDGITAEQPVEEAPTPMPEPSAE
jgi:hypothetical protein